MKVRGLMSSTNQMPMKNGQLSLQQERYLIENPKVFIMELTFEVYFSLRAYFCVLHV